MDDQTPVANEKKPPRPVKLAVVVVIAVLVALIPALLVRGLVYGFKGWNFRWSDRIGVFEGDSNRAGAMETPMFEVQHDWIADVELSGTFTKVTLHRPYVPGVDDSSFYDSQLLDPMQPTDRITSSISIGGTYVLRFEGTGTWKATIRQPR